MANQNQQNGPSGAAQKKTDYAAIVSLVIEVIILMIRFWYYCIESIVKAFMPKPKVSVAGKNVLITGTGHGIGRQLALQYAELGANVICWDINEKNNQETVKQVRALGGKATGYVCNVMDRQQIIDVAEKCKKEHGFIGILVNNAGIMPCHPIMETTETEIRNMFEINVLAHFWIIQSFLPEMIKANEGHVVALSSCAGLFGQPNLVPYCGTKFAVRGVMEALMAELHLKNPNSEIKFTTIYPYMVDTGLCKRPVYRFESLMKLVTPSECATSIIEAHLTGLKDASVPRSYVYIDKVGRCLPVKAMQMFSDFLQTYVDSDL